MPAVVVFVDPEPKYDESQTFRWGKDAGPAAAHTGAAVIVFARSVAAITDLRIEHRVVLVARGRLPVVIEYFNQVILSGVDRISRQQTALAMLRVTIQVEEVITRGR